jgi:hypothetical protein
MMLTHSDPVEDWSDVVSTEKAHVKHDMQAVITGGLTASPEQIAQQFRPKCSSTNCD